MGWYLMTPPLSPAGYADDTAPIASWHYEGSFDTARDCDNSKPTLFAKKSEGLKKLEEQQTTTDLHAFDQFRKELHAEFNLSRCIATDDPRLKGN
jgi:hypothetical protein